MLDVLMDRAGDRWQEWFPVDRVPELAPLLLAGGPAHRDRVSLLVFASGSDAPKVIMKVGFTRREGEFLTSEFAAMDRLWPQLPTELQGRVPRALDLFRFGDATAVAAEVLTGKRLLVPRLTGSVTSTAQRIMDSFFRRSFDFSRLLADATRSPKPAEGGKLAAITDDFAGMFLGGKPKVEEVVRSFGSSIAAKQIEWHPAWQHQDVAVGNVLDDRGELRFVDWEHAGPGCPPWFDIAFAPVITSHLARRIDRLPSVRSAALAVLGADTPIGLILAKRLEEVWDYPLPLAWGVTLAAMKGAMRRLDDGREGSPEWAELVELMLCDHEFRERLDWLAPRW